MSKIDEVNYTLQNTSLGLLNVQKSGNTLLFNYPCQLSVTCTPYIVSLPRGVYKMSLWGAQGGSSRTINDLAFLEDSGGRGAFVSGMIKIFYDSKFFLYVGGKGEDLTVGDANAFGRGGFNGGGNGGYDVDETFGESNSGGGGASDVRLIGEDSIEGYKSRIIVAGGGGSRLAHNFTTKYHTDSNNVKYTFSTVPGDAGTLEGFNTSSFTVAGTQTSGCFGKGDDGVNIDKSKASSGGSIGGGGGGYYGGSHIDVSKVGNISSLESSGAGGSSFVSGCKGCNAVSRLPLNRVVHTNQNKHFSGLYFFGITMKSGKDKIKSPLGADEIGHHNNGAISIIYVSGIIPITCMCRRKNNIGMILVMISISC